MRERLESTNYGGSLPHFGHAILLNKRFAFVSVLGEVRVFSAVVEFW